MSTITNLRRHIFVLEPEVVFGLSLSEVDATVTAMKECGIYKMPHERGVAVELMIAAEDCLKSERHGLPDDYLRELGLPKRLPPLEHLKSYADHPAGPNIIRKVWRQIDVDLDLDMNDVRALTLRRLPRNRCRLTSRDQRFTSAENFERITEHGEEIIESKIGLFHPAPGAREDRVEHGRLTYEQYLTDLRNILIVSLCSKGIVRETRQVNHHDAPGPIQANTTTITRVSLPAHVPSPYQGGTHASPRMHLRRGHVTHQRFGPGRTQVKPLFIEPTWVNADSEFSVRRISTHESVRS